MSVPSACVSTSATKFISPAAPITICASLSARTFVFSARHVLSHRALRLAMFEPRALFVRTGFSYFFLYFAAQLFTPFTGSNKCEAKGLEHVRTYLKFLACLFL